MRVSDNQMFYRSLNGVLGLQEAVNRYNNQISSGKRLAQPSDDPVASSQILNITQRLSAFDQFDRNANLADLRLSEQETAIGSTSDTLQRVRELVLRGRNPSLSRDDRLSITAEIKQRFTELVGLGNTRNSSGEYLFSGTAVDIPAFTSDAARNVSFNGNQTVRELRVAEARTLPEGFTGAEVFMGVRNGNGTFVTDLGGANTGSGRVVNQALTDITAFAPHDFRLVFTAANTFDVVDDTAGTTVLSAQPYSDGATIGFNGLSLSVTGQPAAGDTFLVGPSRNQSVFETVNNVIQGMEVDLSTPNAQATFAANMGRALTDIDQAMQKMNDVRASIGARQNALETQRKNNEDLKLQLSTAKSKLEDVDPVQAISELARQSQILAAAQQAFVKVQSLSLFNYLR